MRIFISHAADDSELAHRLASLLRDAGLDVFDMYSDIFPGDNWAEKVAAALGQADAMVVLFTPSAVSSFNVSYEVSYALGNQQFKGRVFPVLVTGKGDITARDIPWILNHFRVFELSGAEPDEESVEKITRALATAA